MNVILSIHPKWARLIYEGKKTIEWRKIVPSRLLPIHLSKEKLTVYAVGYSDVPHSVDKIHRICDTCMMPIEVKNPWNDKEMKQ